MKKQTGGIIIGSAAAIIIALALIFSSSGDEILPDPEKRAVDMTNTAISLYQQKGSIDSFKEITYGDSLRGGESYVFVVDASGEIVAHGGNSTRVGYALENIENNPVRDIIMTEASPTGKWIKYTWENPVTEEKEPKKSFVKTFDGYIFGSGFYNP